MTFGINSVYLYCIEREAVQMIKRIEGISKIKIPFDMRHRQSIGILYLLAITGFLLYLLTRGV